jgi:hypothetical protein
MVNADLKAQRDSDMVVLMNMRGGPAGLFGAITTEQFDGPQQVLVSMIDAQNHYVQLSQ